MINYFEVLNVSENADLEVIRASYKALAKKYHPDNSDLPREEAEEKMALINEAYDVLSDDEKRKKHIEELYKAKEVQEVDKGVENAEEIHIRKKKPFYKKMWVWCLVIILCFVGLRDKGLGNSDTKDNIYNVVIRVTYERSKGLNYRDDAVLYVDGEEIADIEYASDEEYNLQLSGGKHEIYLKKDALFRKNKTNKLEVNISEEDTYIPIIAKEDTVKGLRISLDSSVEMSVLQTDSKEVDFNDPLAILKSKAFIEKCETTVCKNESTGYTYIDDFSNMSSFDDVGYFDEVVLGAWYNKLGMPIADHFPANMDLFLSQHGGNTSRFLKDFYFVDGETFNIDELKTTAPEKKATYAIILKNIEIICQDNSSEMIGLVGFDFISGEMVIVMGGFYDINNGDVMLVFGEYAGVEENVPYFIGIHTENITERFTAEELQSASESIVLPPDETVDLGTLGIDIEIDDFVNIPRDDKIRFRGDFLKADPWTGASLLYREKNSDGSIKFLYFVDMDDSYYVGMDSNYGYIEEELAGFAHFNFDGKVTENIIEKYNEPRFMEETSEEIRTKIERVDKVMDNYYICYMREASRTDVDLDLTNLDVESNKEYISIGDTAVWSNELEFSIVDSGFWNDKERGANVYFDIMLKGEPFAYYDDLLMAIANMQFWGDGRLIADYPWAQIDGENINATYSYSLDYKATSVRLRVYAPCSKMDYDSSSEIGATFENMKNIVFVVKTSHSNDESPKTVVLNEISGINNTGDGYYVEYILPNSDTDILSMDDLEGMSPDDCKIARNEIYARHGRMFSDPELQAYFESWSWYEGYISPEDFSEDMLSEIEKANRDLIIEYESEMGYR